MMFGARLLFLLIVVTNTVLFVDELTKHSWLFPLKVKFKVYSVFVRFKAYVENMVGNKIKTLRTYSGGKFTSFVFNYFLLAHSIGHQYSCPHITKWMC